MRSARISSSDDSGVLMNPTMIDYQVPTAPQIPLIEEKLITIESHDPTHPLAIKGIGESGITPAAGAIACAVYDAIGTPITSLPITPEAVLDAIDAQLSDPEGGSSGSVPIVGKALKLDGRSKSTPETTRPSTVPCSHRASALRQRNRYRSNRRTSTNSTRGMMTTNNSAADRARSILKSRYQKLIR